MSGRTFGAVNDKVAGSWETVQMNSGSLRSCELLPDSITQTYSTERHITIGQFALSSEVRFLVIS